MGKLIKRPVKSQILGSSSSLKTRSNNPFGFKTTSDIFAIPSNSTLYTVATGGVITQVGDYKVHTFNSSANFVVSQLGTAPYNVVEYLVVAGGGSGGGNDAGTGGGGGGAGGYLTNTGLSITAQSYAVVVGSGGISSNGTNTSFNSLISIGGARGRFYLDTPSNGGSGGGGGGWSTNSTATLGTVGQGNNGGNGKSGANYNSGGGGGAGSAGSIFVGNNGGAGGVGLANSISGTSVFYAGGGGGSGGSSGSGIGGLGGNGGGGAGGKSTNAIDFIGSPATINTGGGGGGTAPWATFNGGAGGSGIVIIKYKFQ